VLRRHWIELAWAAFTLSCTVILFGVAEWETIPFHLIWVSLALVYGFRYWRLGTTVAIGAVVTIVTGAALLRAASDPTGPGLDELAEVPLMGLMFAAMVWHTERVKRLVTERERLLERQQEFVRDASHGLRTPITIARGHAELVRDGLPAGTPRDDTEIVLDELDRLARLSDRMLILAAAEHPNFLALDAIDVRSLVERTMSRWAPAADRRWRGDDVVDGALDADQERLEMVLDILIENAVKVTGLGGVIALSARADGSHLVVRVGDDGPGIDPEALPGLFQPFSRKVSRGAGESGGTGVGLAAARAIVDAHGGTIVARNSREGGAVFEIRLPRFTPAGGDDRSSRRGSRRSSAGEADRVPGPAPAR
jgi:signal transduction histidine kinase